MLSQLRKGNKGVRVVKNLRSNKKSNWRRLQIDPFSDTAPLLVEETVAYLHASGLAEEGVFRTSGGKRDVQTIIQAYSKGRKVELSKYGPQTVSLVLKLFLLNLADPPFTNELTECFFDAIEENGEAALQANLAAVKSTLKLLPEGNRVVLRQLFGLLHAIAESDSNRIWASDLATCLTTCLFNIEEESSTELKKAHLLVETLIKSFNLLFGTKELATNDRRFQQKLFRKSMALSTSLKAKLREMEEEEAADEAEDEEESESKGFLHRIPLVNRMLSTAEYMKVLSQNREILVVGTSVRREWFLMVLYVLFSLIPVVYTPEVWSAALTGILLYAVYQSLPVKEEWTLNKAENQVKQELRVANRLRRSNMYELKRIADVVVEEHETKRGAYRTVLMFQGGIAAPLTKDFFYSPRGRAQREVAAEILKFKGLNA